MVEYLQYVDLVLQFSIYPCLPTFLMVKNIWANYWLKIVKNDKFRSPNSLSSVTPINLTFRSAF
jgi:hypothetical protein